MRLKLKNFPFVKQLDSADCGLACIRIITRHYGIKLASNHRKLLNANLTRQGLTFSDIKSVSERVGYKSLVVRLNFAEAVENVNLPAIFYWNQNHFIVVYKISKNKVYVSDPAVGRLVYKKDDFIEHWTGDKEKGAILLLQPTPKLEELDKSAKKEVNLKYILSYLFAYKTQLFFICLTLFFSSLIDLLLPFFTQKIIDDGVKFQDISLMYLLLSGQMILFVSKIANEYYRSWLFIHISTRINIKLILNFLDKLMMLPIKFFDSKNTGDLLQRIEDNRRVETFLSSDILQFVFSSFTIVAYTIVLFLFNTEIAYLYVFGTAIKLFWIFRFLKRIAILDRKQFYLLSRDQNKILEFVKGMQEIKINNLEAQKKVQWEEVQSNLFKHDIEKLQLEQKYEGYRFINFIINILVIFYAALAVVNDGMTYGTMLAIVFVLGGMNAPMSRIINFFLQLKRVQVSFERMNEIHDFTDENASDISPDHQPKNSPSIFNKKKDISFKNVNFSYNGTFALKNIDISIPIGKTTAIVGVSGSGKTTLLKLLLKFYQPQKGSINIQDENINSIDNYTLRKQCGVIMQDSFIFSESIAYNIALDYEYDEARLKEAAKLANINDFIESLPLRSATIIGNEGVSVSHGQRQRILIARVIYKNPELILFDEATNSLDAKNESAIIHNINNYFAGKTLVVVAHRLSTVKNADQIIVMDDGQIIEKGTHESLIALKGGYYTLIKNQLDLTGVYEKDK